ncbi:MAG: hypothetical protein ACJ798_08090 [Phenylobacterium sp.]
MAIATRSALAGVLAALGLATAAQAGLPLVVSADQEAERANPGRKARPTAQEAPRTGADFRTTMDQVFGSGRWRQTSGYRTRAQEDALRRHGAGTVAAGQTSKHSTGGAAAPGAYDAVVDGLPIHAAAARLQRSGAPFAKVIAEGRHGPQGPHLHIELASTRPE